MNFRELHRITEAASRELARGGSPFLWGRIAADIEAGRAQLFATDQGSYVVLSVQKPDLVILACTGNDGRGIMRAVIDLCAQNDCEFVRFVTKRSGMERLLREFKPESFGTIYRVKANENESHH